MSEDDTRRPPGTDDLTPVAQIRTSEQGAGRLLADLFARLIPNGPESPGGYRLHLGTGAPVAQIRMAAAEGGPPEAVWRSGLCALHCRPDRCEIGCSCPGHQPDGTHVPQSDEPVGECGHSALDAVDGCTDPIHPAPDDILEPLRRTGQWESAVHDHAPWAVVLPSARMAWLIDAGEETALTFAGFVSEEIDPAFAVRLRDPALELLSWREAVANPDERRLAAVRQLAERWQAGGPDRMFPPGEAAAQLLGVLYGDPGPGPASRRDPQE
jgi:hypothetical protein